MQDESSKGDLNPSAISKHSSFSLPSATQPSECPNILHHSLPVSNPGTDSPPCLFSTTPKTRSLQNTTYCCELLDVTPQSVQTARKQLPYRFSRLSNQRASFCETPWHSGQPWHKGWPWAGWDVQLMSCSWWGTQEHAYLLSARVSPHFPYAPVCPSHPKASFPPLHQLNWGGFLYQAVLQLQSLAQDLSQWFCSLQQWAELLLSVLGHTQCGRTLGTFWSHQFSPQIMSPSSHVPIEMRNQKWLWQHSSPSNTTIKGRDFLKSKFTRQESINKVCEFSSGVGICNSHSALMML